MPHFTLGKDPVQLVEKWEKGWEQEMYHSKCSNENDGLFSPLCMMSHAYGPSPLHSSIHRQGMSPGKYINEIRKMPDMLGQAEDTSRRMH